MINPGFHSGGIEPGWNWFAERSGWAERSSKLYESAAEVAAGLAAEATSKK